MEKFLFDQLDFVRKATLKNVESLGEGQVDVVPTGFNNSIRWNLGHIYLVQERFAFHFAQEPLLLPEGFEELFGGGTKPADWKLEPPTLAELTRLLQEQTKRIRERLHNRLDEVLVKPLIFPSGISFKTIGELLTFSMYHEGGHTQNIKILKKLC